MKHLAITTAAIAIFCLAITTTVIAQEEMTLPEMLEKFLGDSGTWAIAGLGELKKDMTYAEVRSLYTDLADMDISEKAVYKAEVKIGCKLVSFCELKFRKGKLYGAIVNFRSDLDKEEFKSASLVAFENKWGKVKEDKREKDTINKFSSDGYGAQRSWLVDHWIFEVDIP